jgi:alkanesulfonate monooxygenase SsuD/methylene tetrahydromethanopterin reductase-like flavin-dependent oxidoreductase (luciferase family)
MYTRGGENAAQLILDEMPDQWVEDLVVAGDPAECVEKIQALIDAGSDSVCLAPQPADRVDEVVALIASDVLPHVKPRAVQA